MRNIEVSRDMLFTLKEKSFSSNLEGKYGVVLVGEFDLIVNKFYYFVYKFTFAFYKRIKKVFFKIRGGK